MTRDNFIENVTTWEELINFCNEYDCEVCEDIYDNEQKDVEIDRMLPDVVSEYDWESVKELLNNIPVGYEYYKHESGEIDDWEWMDDYGDFDDYKEEVVEWMDDNELWDEEEAVEEETEIDVDSLSPISELFKI